MSKDAMLNLNEFYPTTLRVSEMIQEQSQIIIRMKSITTSCVCPECKQVSTRRHGTYIRKVQDLPIWGKRVHLEITSHEYNCENDSCKVSTIAETFDGFLNYYSRMTERCTAFISTLALETSGEGCSRICKEMGLQISGDSVIRLLLKRFENQMPETSSEIIGIDDFAFKKRHTYGTIIVDGKSHHPIAILDGRDGQGLRQWLKANQHIKTITRDRASAYAKVISEELPDVMQIADRFHLHQNLLTVVKSALNHVMPVTIPIVHDNQGEESVRDSDTSKKNYNQCG